MTPLHWACSRGHLDVVKLLISHGASIDKQTRWKLTPLMKAVQHNRCVVASHLLAIGADTDILDMERKRAYDFVKSPEMAEVFKEYDRDPEEFAFHILNPDFSERLFREDEDERLDFLVTRYLMVDEEEEQEGEDGELASGEGVSGQRRKIVFGGGGLLELRCWNWCLLSSPNAPTAPPSLAVPVPTRAIPLVVDLNDLRRPRPIPAIRRPMILDLNPGRAVRLPSQRRVPDRVVRPTLPPPSPDPFIQNLSPETPETPIIDLPDGFAVPLSPLTTSPGTEDDSFEMEEEVIVEEEEEEEEQGTEGQETGMGIGGVVALRFRVSEQGREIESLKAELRRAKRRILRLQCENAELKQWKESSSQ